MLKAWALKIRNNSEDYASSETFYSVNNMFATMWRNELIFLPHGKNSKPKRHVGPIYYIH